MNKNGTVINLETLGNTGDINNILEVKGNEYLFKGKSFSKKEWFLDTNTFNSFTKNRTSSRYINNIHPVYQKKIFIDNINYATKIALVFPVIFFAFVSMLILLFLIFINKFNLSYSEVVNYTYYFAFLLMLLIAFSLVLFFKYLIGYKMYISKKYGRVSFNHLKKERYQEMINCFDILISSHKSGQYIVKNDNIAIREISTFDLFDYYKMLSNKKVVKYLLNKTAKSYIEVLNLINIHQEDYKKNLYFRLAIVNVENVMIGYIGISKVGLTKDQCEIVYGLDQQYWYQGYTTKAVTAFVSLLINKGYKRIIATHIDKNVNSGKVLLKSGFILNKDLNRVMRFKNKKYNLIGYEYEEKE